MDATRDFDRDEVTQRTALALQAEQEAFKAQMGVMGLRRQAKRMNWVWSVLIVIGAIFSAGYALRDQVAHYATKEQTEENTARIDRIEKREDSRDEHIKSQTEMIKRLSDSVDRLTDHLLRDRGHAR